MDHLSLSSLSKYQIFIVDQRLKGKTYEYPLYCFTKNFKLIYMITKFQLQSKEHVLDISGNLA